MRRFEFSFLTTKYRWIAYAAAFGMTVFIAFAALILCAFLPQEPIDEHIIESAEIMIWEGTYPVTADHSDGAVLDNFTDAMILMQSKSLQDPMLSYSLTNPKFHTSSDPVESLYNYAYAENPEISSYYYRYWMGFRTFVRLYLVFMNYYEFKRYLAFALFFLFALLICKIQKHTNIKIAMAFAISIILVRPDVICNSIQYSICFFIAFLAMLGVPWIYRNPRFETLFFMEIGMLTMYFDFYTTPILTFGLPATYLYLIRAFHNQNTSAKHILRSGFVWLFAYGFMWIAKLSLVSLMTSLNGFENSILLPFYNSNLANLSEVNIFEMIYLAYQKVFSTVWPKETDKILAASVVLLLMGYWLIRALKRKWTTENLKQNTAIFVIPLFPLVWYAASNRALQNHFYFQNRSIAVIFWVVGAYFILTELQYVKKTANKPHIETV